ncbi:MAG TPA: hypothetical protein VG222_08440, partial [Vicinamibacterales bacterium]|nr:hypothetical protein [Vicinamibacterales bacterium]
MLHVFDRRRNHEETKTRSPKNIQRRIEVLRALRDFVVKIPPMIHFKMSISRSSDLYFRLPIWK